MNYVCDLQKKKKNYKVAFDFFFFSKYMRLETKQLASSNYEYLFVLNIVFLFC